MPGKNKEPTQKVETPVLKRKPLIRLREGENPIPNAGEEESIMEDDVENEDVGCSQEEGESVGENAESKRKQQKDEKDKGPSKLYPDVPRLDDHDDDHKTSGDSWIHVIWILLAVASYFLASNLLLTDKPPPSSEVENSVPLFDVDAVVWTLRREFGSLHDKDFRVLKAALRRVNTGVEPEAPAVLLVVSPEDDGGDRFARRLARLLDENYVPFSGTELGRMADSKILIDDAIRENAEKRNGTVFLVSQLQRLTFDTTMIFHGYCDDQNAPYKRVVYVMTVTCDPFEATTKRDQIATDCLTRSWPEVHADMMTPLITRLTPSLIILQKKIMNLR